MSTARSVTNAAVVTGLVLTILGNFTGSSIANNAILLIYASLIAYYIIPNPFAGLALLLALLPITQILPDLPGITSINTLVGLLCLAGTVSASRRYRTQSNRLKSKHSMTLAIGLILLVWIVSTHPEAALLRNNERNWAFTYLQLMVLLWLAFKLVDDSEKLRLLLQMLVVSSAISAIFARLGGALTEEQIIRSGGLAGGENTAARYFVASLVGAYYLYLYKRDPVRQALLIIGTGVLFIGLIYTVSRSGLILLAVGIISVFLLRTPHESQAKYVWYAFIFLILVLLVPAIFFDFMDTNILPSIMEGSDTMGMRYAFWKAGFRMWSDNPMTGVGIGQFPRMLQYYLLGDLSTRYYGFGAHNGFISMLAETGLIGLGLFLAIILSAMGFFKSASQTNDRKLALMSRAWFVILVVMVFGNLTKHDHFDKLLWLCFGIAPACLSIKERLSESRQTTRQITITSAK